MPYRVVELYLTDEQIADINAAIGDSTEPFALLAQPKVRGEATGQMKVYIASAEQYKAIERGVQEGRRMTAWPATDSVPEKE